MKKLNLLLPLMIFLLLSSACKKNKKDQVKIDEDLIVQYIADHNLDAYATGTGLYYVVDKIGTGAKPNVNSHVRVAYKGYLIDGSVFDQSSATGIELSLQSVIDGWKEGIPYFKEGGSGKLLIPSALGYGSNSQSGIPANSVLIFDIDLIDVY